MNNQALSDPFFHLYFCKNAFCSGYCGDFQLDVVKAGHLKRVLIFASAVVSRLDGGDGDLDEHGRQLIQDLGKAIAGVMPHG